MVRTTGSRAEQPGRVQPWWTWRSVRVVAVMGAVFLAYWPSLRGEFVWDDDAWTAKLAGLFRSWSGLGGIWSWPTRLQQYYPLTATTFWIDYQLWGFWTVPYHVENVLLHLAAGGLFWKLLRRLEVQGAGLAALVFLLHPLMVESVAWITERKNTLSLSLFLGALLAYGRFANYWRATGLPAVCPSRPPAPSGQKQVAILGAVLQSAPLSPHLCASRDWRAWAGALFLFLAAYLAKATTFAFPAVVLLLCWWKRGRLRLREDVLPTLPFFALSVGLGFMISWLERNHIGAHGPEWQIPFPDRCVIAGHAVWFYVGKLLWPVNLCFVYPRWPLDHHSTSAWLWPASAAGVFAALWFLRRRLGRGPLVAALFYAGAIFPLLGFINAYFMRYSFVSDHWSYLPSLGLVALAASLIARLAVRRPSLIHSLAGAAILALATLTFLQSANYRDAETLYRVTLLKNPSADLAHDNLGLLLFQAGQTQEAIAHFQMALEIRPASAHAHNNLANALRFTGRFREAASHYEASLRSEPDNSSTCNNLAMLLATSPDPSLRNGARAVELAQHANQLSGGSNPIVLGTLAAAYAETGRFADAAAAARAALRFASRRGNGQLVQALQEQIQRYESGLPSRDMMR